MTEVQSTTPQPEERSIIEMPWRKHAFSDVHAVLEPVSTLSRHPLHAEPIVAAGDFIIAHGGHALITYNSELKLVDWQPKLPLKIDRLTLLNLRTPGYLALEGFNTIYPYRVIDEQDKPITPASWRALPEVKKQEINIDLISRFPFLAELEPGNAGVLVHNGLFRLCFSDKTLSLRDTKSGNVLFSDKCVNYSLDSKDSDRLLYIYPDSNKLISASIEDLSLGRTITDEVALPIAGKITDFKIDPFGNYFIITTVKEALNELFIIERDSGEIVSRVENVNAPLTLDRKGNIFFLTSSHGTDHNIRVISTNFQFIADGGLNELSALRQQQLAALEDKIAELELPALEKPTKATNEDPKTQYDKRLQMLSRSMEERFGPEIERAASLEDLERLTKQLQLLKERRDLRTYHEIFQGLDERLGEKKDLFKIEKLIVELKSMSEIDTLTTINYKERKDTFTQVKEERSSIVIRDTKTRAAIDGTIADIESGFKTFSDKIQPEVKKELEEKWNEIKCDLARANTLPELEECTATAAAKGFNRLLGLLNKSEEIQTWKTLFASEFDSHRQRLDANKRSIEESKSQDTLTNLAELRELRKNALASLTSIKTIEEFERWSIHSPLVKDHQQKARLVPEALRDAEIAAFEALLSQRREELRGKDIVDNARRKGIVQFGSQKIAVFPPFSMRAEPRIEPLYRGASKGRLTFECCGREFEPNSDLIVPIDMKNAETKSAVEKYQEEAHAHFNQRARKVPAFQRTWTVNPWVEHKLELMIRDINILQRLGKGLLILEGDAGTGKNVLASILAHFTNRELFSFACNRQTEKEDLMYAYLYDSSRGTYKAPAELLSAIQTPGSVVLLDEINTLPIGVSKLFNPLFDHQRKLADKPADPSVVFMGLMNPRGYLGTQPLPQEFLDRAIVLNVEYPPLKDASGKRYTGYEAEIGSKYIAATRELQQEQFYKLWNHVVNNEPAPEADRLLTREREQAIRDLHQITKTADVIRSAYRACQSGENQVDDINLVFSIRQSEFIAALLDHGLKVKDSIKEIILPKARDDAERKKLGDLIDNVGI